MDEFGSLDNSRYMNNLDSYTSTFNSGMEKYQQAKEKAQSTADAINTAIQTPLQTVGGVFVAKGVGRGTKLVKDAITKRFNRGIGDVADETQPPIPPPDDMPATYRQGGNVQDELLEGDPEDVATQGGDLNILPEAGTQAVTDTTSAVTGGSEGAVLGEELGVDASQGFADPLTDIATLATGLGFVLAGALGKTKPKAPKMPQPLNPSFQAGVY